MQGILKSQRQLSTASTRFATSQRGMVLQLGLSHVCAAGGALVAYAWLNRLHLQQPYPLLIALGVAGALGLLCTLNLQYNLYLLELTLSHLAHDPLTSSSQAHDYPAAGARRWPLGRPFAHLQEINQRIQQYATNELLTSDLRTKTLQQAGEAAALAERNRIARELHDSIKQQIFSISVSAAAAKAHWLGQNSAEAQTAIADIQRSAKEAQVEMQALLQQLRPAPLENTSLVDALRIQAQALGFRSGAQVYIEIGELPDQRLLLPGTQEAIFRLVQEAFANIARHARASTVWLTLRHTTKFLHISVRDDGQGFVVEEASGGMGLNNLRERTRELHGQIAIESQPGQGTSLSITLPLLQELHSAPRERQQAYSIERASELARRGYQLGENTSFLSIALIALTVLINIHWSVVVLGVLVALYGYASGFYYRIQVALRAGQESKIALELRRMQYHTLLNLTRLVGFALWYGFRQLHLPNFGVWWWALLCLLLGMTVSVQVARRKHYLNSERYYALLSAQELRWELERRHQGLMRTLTLWFIACAIGLISAHTLLAPVPLTFTQQTADGIALILLIMGVALLSEYRQIQRWRHILAQREHNSAGSAVEK